MERHELTDVQWEVLEPCLPPLNTGRGCKMHNTVERMFGHLKECRCVATRYEKLAVHYHPFLKIACIRYLSNDKTMT